MRQQQRPRQQSTSVLNNNEQRLHNQVRHLLHNNPAPKMSRSRNNPASDHSLSAGYVRDLEQCQESELIDIKKKNMHILGNPYVYIPLNLLLQGVWPPFCLFYILNFFDGDKKKYLGPSWLPYLTKAKNYGPLTL